MITGTTTSPIYALGTTANSFLSDVGTPVVIICAFLLFAMVVNKLLKSLGREDVEFAVDEDEAFPL